MLKALGLLMCQASDMEKSVVFYRDICGFKLNFQSPGWSDLDLGNGVRLGLHSPFDGSTPPYAIYPKGWIVGFYVDDILAFRQRLTENGVTLHGDLHDIPGGVIFDFGDPDGNAIEVMQTGVTVAELTG